MLESCDYRGTCSIVFINKNQPVWGDVWLEGTTAACPHSRCSRCVLFSQQPGVCGVVAVFVRCICVVWAEIHWMYPPHSPRGRAGQCGQLSLEGCCWCFLIHAAVCVCPCVHVCDFPYVYRSKPCVCVYFPVHLPSLNTHALSWVEVHMSGLQSK